jgi:hypothetical protein
MPDEPSALARRPEPGAADDDDYQAFCAALSESARGRAFLAEYARRNRHADTQVLLAALARLEARVAADGAAVERLRDELRTLLIAIRLARPGIDAGSTPEKAANLASLLGLLERRIDAMAEVKMAEVKLAEAKPADIAPPADATLGAAVLPDEPAAEPERARLAVVPPPDEPELPIPSPANAQAPAIALVQTKNVPSAAMMPEVTFAESLPPAPPVVETIAAEPVASPPPNPLAAIMALSDDERLALFT